MIDDLEIEEVLFDVACALVFIYIICLFIPSTPHTSNKKDDDFNQNMLNTQIILLNANQIIN